MTPTPNRPTFAGDTGERISRHPSAAVTPEEGTPEAEELAEAKARTKTALAAWVRDLADDLNAAGHDPKITITIHVQEDRL